MISSIEIQNFKSLKDIKFECGNLNLLSGYNGMGKSSVIQTLLLLKQSNDKGYLTKNGLTLKGDLTNIGVGKDALYQLADEKEEIKFGLSFKGIDKKYEWIFEYETNENGINQKYHDSDVLPFGENAEKPIDLDILPLFNTHLKYLNADRWVRNQYERSDFEVIQNRRLGIHGEFTTHYLTHFGSQKSEEVNESLLYGGTDIKALDYQVSAWMNEISPGTSVKADKILGVDAVKLRYGFKSDKNRIDEILPSNVGFGVTYALPIIVALLSAKFGDILIIENPESHLHPQGQSSIGRLMAKVAQQGVQIFVETHSDHILNGVCVGVRNGEIENSNVKFYFLLKNPSETFTTKYEVPVSQDGRVDDTVLRQLGIEGFFDQINKDLEKILFAPSNEK